MELSAEQQELLKQQKLQCPFCQIIDGKIPAHKVYEDDLCIAILDINPKKPGHLLFMPKEHYPIMPLIPERTFEHMFGLLPDITKLLRECMLTKYCSVFIANGPAAGQQSTHFLIHVIPSDDADGGFNLLESQVDPQEKSELQKVLSHNLPIMMRKRYALFKPDTAQETPTNDGAVVTPNISLAELIASNPEFKKMIIEKPEAVLAGLEDNPSLKPLFEGVDVYKLSEQLRVQEVPRAVDLSDQQLIDYLLSNKKLLHYLQNDMSTLKQAISNQPKLKRFFEGTTPEEVLERTRWSS